MSLFLCYIEEELIEHLEFATGFHFDHLVDAIDALLSPNANGGVGMGKNGLVDPLAMFIIGDYRAGRTKRFH